MMFHCLRVELGCFSFDDPQSTLRALTKAGPEAVTIDILDQFGLTIHYFNGALGTGNDALPAAIAIFFINFNYFSNRFHAFLQNHIFQR
jgi:hypothetical protein